MQNFTPFGATVAEISVTGRRKNSNSSGKNNTSPEGLYRMLTFAQGCMRKNSPGITTGKFFFGKLHCKCCICGPFSGTVNVGLVVQCYAEKFSEDISERLIT